MPNRWDMPPVFLRSGDPEQENEPKLQYPGQLGMRFTVIQPTRATPGAESGRSKTYQLIKTDSTMSVAPYLGAVAWWADKTQYLTTTSASKLGRGRIAGVYQNAITPGNYGCVQTGGPATTKLVDAPTAAPTIAGLFVIPSATDGKADVVSTAPAFPVLGLTASVLNVGDNTIVADLDVPQTT